MTIKANTTTTESSRVCPTCKGKGINPVDTTRVCPKCNGECEIGPAPAVPYTPPQPLPQPEPRRDLWYRRPWNPWDNGTTWRIPVGHDDRIICRPNTSLSSQVSSQQDFRTQCWN